LLTSFSTASPLSITFDSRAGGMSVVLSQAGGGFFFLLPREEGWCDVLFLKVRGGTGCLLFLGGPVCGFHYGRLFFFSWAPFPFDFFFSPFQGVVARFISVSRWRSILFRY